MYWIEELPSGVKLKFSVPPSLETDRAREEADGAVGLGSSFGVGSAETAPAGTVCVTVLEVNLPFSNT